MPDVELRCVHCQQIYNYSEREQENNYRRNQPAPQRCAACRPSRRKMANTNGEAQTARHEIVCDRCGKADTVPFAPKPGRSVLCSECFGASRIRARVA